MNARNYCPNCKYGGRSCGKNILEGWHTCRNPLDGSSDVWLDDEEATARGIIFTDSQVDMMDDCPFFEWPKYVIPRLL